MTGYLFWAHSAEGAFIYPFVKQRRKDRKIMKKTLTSVISLVLVAVFMLSVASCAKSVDVEGLWKQATYTRDKSFGKGDTTVLLEVKVEEQSVTFTIKTDKDILGDALLEHGIIEGEEGPYGLYVKKVNGITADYDVDRSYWALKKNGADLMTGVDMTEIADGEHYEFVYTK